MTDMIEVKTADLAGEALNWAVAIAEGHKPFVQAAHYGIPDRVFIEVDRDPEIEGSLIGKRYKPCTDWACCGPLIDKYWPTFSFVDGLIRAEVILASGEPFSAVAPNYLVAACRAIGAARHGETVQIPKELMP